VRNYGVRRPASTGESGASRSVPGQSGRAAPQSIADALALRQLGKLHDAERTCIELLRQSIDSAGARALLAEILNATGRHGEAAEHLRRLAEAQPSDGAARRRLGDALFAAGDFAAAAKQFRRAIAIEPNHPRAHNNLGRTLLKLQQRDLAIASFRRAIELEPNYAIAHSNLGMALAEAAELEDALACYDRAVALQPSLAEAHSNRGNLLIRLDRSDEALESQERALALDPRNATLYCNLGNVLFRLNRFSEALGRYEQAIELDPEYLEALNSRGNVLRELKRFVDAFASYDRALSLKANDFLALIGKASVYLEFYRAHEALDYCDRALAIQSAHPPALLYRGLALALLERNHEAAECFEQLLTVSPGHFLALGYLIYCRGMICDWSDEARVDEALQEIANDRPVVSPLALLSLTDSPELQLKCGRACISHAHPPSRQMAWNGETWRNKKIRVAYLSADFRQHAMSYLMVGVFEKHDRERFETISVSFRQPERDEFAQRVMKSNDVFVDVCDLSDLDAAKTLREMQIDIAVDLMGFTRSQRINIFAHRPAPLQIAYLGFPGTCGAPYIDYLLADEFVVPPESQSQYSEKIVYMPDTFQANDDRRTIAQRRLTRVELGLPEGAFVFCSFNKANKLRPQMFDIWCRLLARLPETVLWLLSESDTAQDNLIRAAAERGIGAERLIFAQRGPYQEHLARLSLADLFLDTFPFNGGTTTSDALWAGLPVLTCCGHAFASRMSGSLLRSVGLSELITHNLADYEQLATRLARTPVELALLRTRLSANRLTQPLFQTERFCRNLESAYEAMHERLQRGEPAASFRVAPPAPSPTSIRSA
jgi:protein O-GlcNAc transferase